MGREGILSRPGNDDIKVPERAYRVAKGHPRAASGGRQEGRSWQAFEAAVGKARRRDCLVVVTWTGNADVDLAVEEPAGTICSRGSRGRPAAACSWAMASAAASPAMPRRGQGIVRKPTCAAGVQRRVSRAGQESVGQADGGKVTIDIYTNYGTEQQRVIHEQIPLG